MLNYIYSIVNPHLLLFYNGSNHAPVSYPVAPCGTFSLLIP